MSLLSDINARRQVHYRETKAEIVEYYEEKGMSFAKLARDISPFTVNPKTGEAYKPRNLERRFNPDRINKPAHSTKDKGEYAMFGRTLPPIITIPEFDVHFKGRVKISGKWYKREFTVHVGPDGISFNGQVFVSPEEMQAFLESGDESWLFLAYFEGDDLAEDWEGTFTIL